MTEETVKKTGGKWVYVKAPRKTSMSQTDRGMWADKKKYEAVAVFIATGSPTETAIQTKIPYETIKKWRKQDWWAEKVKELQDEDYSRLDAKISKTIDKALDELIDRVDKGDSMYDPRTGKIVRVPAKMRDVNKAFDSLLEKRQLLRKQPTKIVQQESTANQLQNLAEQFAKFVTGQTKTEKLEDLHVLVEEEDVFQNEEGIYEVKDNPQDKL